MAAELRVLRSVAPGGLGVCSPSSLSHVALSVYDATHVVLSTNLPQQHLLKDVLLWQLRRCPDLEDVRLPCGAVAAHSRLWSLYRVDGPYLQEVNASIPGTWVVSGVPLALQASAVLSRHSNLTGQCRLHVFPRLA